MRPVRDTLATAALLAAAATPVMVTPVVAAIAATASPGAVHSLSRDFAFRYEGVLGTSMDLIVRSASARHAELAATAALAEVDRLAALLATRDPDSEISRLARGGGLDRKPGACSSELRATLGLYRTWSQRTGGAVSCCLQPLVDLWHRAASDNALPDNAAIAAALAECRRPAWQSSDTGVVFFTKLLPDIDALGKGFIIDRALRAARAVVGVEAVLLDVGGDIATSGGPWVVGVANPAHAADNAVPLARVALHGQAIATSAAYERPLVIAGRTYSHLLDPRTGRPAAAGVSATVVAADAVSANALALSLCVLGPRDGARLIVECEAAALVVDGDGSIHRLGRPGQFGDVAPHPAAAPAGTWQADHQVSIALTLKQQTGRRTHRPYVAVWIEDGKGNPVRTVTVWGNESKYLRELPRWWKFAQRDQKLVAAVTRATRRPGNYTIVWDGLDDAGKPLPAGDYVVQVEINREHGAHVTKSATIACGSVPAASAKIEATPESEEIAVEYGKK